MSKRGDMVLVTHPDRQPAVDFITRSSEGPFVDTGLDITLRSQPGLPVVTERLYISVPVIRQLAQIAGLSFGEDTAEREVAVEYEARLKAQGKLEGLREGLGDDIMDVARALNRWLDSAGVADNSGGGTSAL